MSKLDDAIEKLREERWDDDSSVNIVIQPPPEKESRAPIRALKLLPPGWRVVVVLVAVVAAAVAGAITGGVLH